MTASSPTPPELRSDNNEYQLFIHHSRINSLISLAALIMFMAVWILMFFDTWRQRRKYSQLKKQMNLTEKRKTKWTPPQGKEL
ncbi:TPA: LapA family protein [Salmonella enterica]|uniref:LapA family protein n=1 Tax=Salmonella enterica TaxID=28901 RepID=UPI00356A472C